jgi:hypothetical protein
VLELVGAFRASYNLLESLQLSLSIPTPAQRMRCDEAQTTSLVRAMLEFLAAEWTSNNMGLPKSTRPMRVPPLRFAFCHHEDEFGAVEFDASPDPLLPNRDQKEVIELMQKIPCAA